MNAFGSLGKHGKSPSITCQLAGFGFEIGGIEDSYLHARRSSNSAQHDTFQDGGNATVFRRVPVCSGGKGEQRESLSALNGADAEEMQERLSSSTTRAPCRPRFETIEPSGKCRLLPEGSDDASGTMTLRRDGLQ